MVLVFAVSANTLSDQMDALDAETHTGQVRMVYI